MNGKITLFVLASFAAMPALAGNDPVGDLSDVTGLSERKVQMVLGNRTAFAEYRYTYDRALARFTRAVGKDAHERLMRGESVALRDAEGREIVVQLPADPHADRTL
ncbi:hypothetical protein [Marilutibacter aestuarii]|uniref:Uncharacterized protein n=1 Tax=Marilutibacter aestuarii TaxID=1706195 RepID=A0A508A839_9GAMM|nr:hypothetical protein [Lysobacter aestuarii]TQD45587.1 hypothetical protein FKV25_07910 [Lysobacter aestuarii]